MIIYYILIGDSSAAAVAYEFQKFLFVFVLFYNSVHKRKAAFTHHRQLQYSLQQQPAVGIELDTEAYVGREGG